MKTKKLLSKKKTTVGGQPSWQIANSDVQAYITEQGGHLGPITYTCKGKTIQPHAIPPWSQEKLPADVPPIVKILRGDFFCMPFGGNDTPYKKKEKYPVHGETANSKWSFAGLGKEANRTTIHLTMKTKIRTAKVDKKVSLIDGHNAVYLQHTVSGMKGPMTFGHHATLHCPDMEKSGVISTSPLKYGMVSPVPAELPENKGYSMLKPGAEFKTLSSVRTIMGTNTDVSYYPARRGFEDIVMLVNKPCEPFAWTAMTFPKEGYVWFALKDPAILKYTLLWMSNGGRHYAPWNGRHVNVIGMEEVTSYFHYGLAESVKTNCIAKKGDKTFFTLNPKKPTTVKYIMAAAKIPNGFDKVKTIKPGRGEDTLVLTSNSGKKVNVSLYYKFLGEN